ncbi:MAG TPA: lipid A biosynthesis acyltransferase [Polyangia bacterium]|nr:lipid A biosynthesis acyltransferase [Polyangia bacterium]
MNATTTTTTTASSSTTAPATTPPPARAAASAGWLQLAEKGSAAGLWLMLGICRLLGRRAARLLLPAIVFYFVVTSAVARRASRRYLRRMGLPAGFRAVFAHCLRFAHVTLDRVFWTLGQTFRFDIQRTGSALLEGARRDGRGAVLIGAHLGSFEAMRAMAERCAHPLNVVGYFNNARLINGLLARFNRNLAVRVIPIEPGVDFVLRLKERIEAGELVALLGDRAGLTDRTVEVDFLGGKAPFPTGPYMLAAMLGCPVFLTFGLYREPNRYQLFCEPFAERVTLGRRSRQADARAQAQRFAERLEHYCRLAPDNWFNFYDFWTEPRA